MNAKLRTLSWGYFLLWLVMAIIGAGVSFAVFFVVMSGLGAAGKPIPVLLSGLIMTATFGTFIALAQWTALRRFLPRSAVWIRATLLGFLICSPILLTLSGGFGPAITAAGSLNMTFALGYVLGVAQWLAISRKVKWSGAWIGASLASWFLAGFAGLALKTLSQQMGPILYWLGLIFAGTLLSVPGMMWLFSIKGDTGVSQPIAPDYPLWRRILRMPGTSLGWWSAAVAATYVVLLIALRTLSGRVSWGQTGALTIVFSISLLSWVAGIVGLVAVMEKRERSAIVWAAMLPSAYALTNTLYTALRELLLPQ